VWEGVDWREIDRFLADYYCDPGAGMMDAALIRRYIDEQIQHDELLRWTVCICMLSRAEWGTEDLGVVDQPPINTISRTRLKTNPRSIGSLVNPAALSGEPGSGDEEIGLAARQQLEARAEASDEDNDITLGEALRKRRSRSDGGLLLIYPISRLSRPRGSNRKRDPLFDDPDREGCTVVGVAMVFPTSSSPAAARWITGSVGLETEAAI
jgi:hypothetical protein